MRRSDLKIYLSDKPGEDFGFFFERDRKISVLNILQPSSSLFLLVSKQEQNRGDAVSRNLLKRDREISASDRFSPDFVSASRLTNTNGRRVVWRSRSRSEPVECESFILMHWGGENFWALDEPRQTWACQYEAGSAVDGATYPGW